MKLDLEQRWQAALDRIRTWARANSPWAIHFNSRSCNFCAGATVLTLRVRIPRGAPSVPSICGVIPAASVFERELSEMFGVTVVGTPNRSRLFIPDDWPEGVYPMRKEFVV